MGKIGYKTRTENAFFGIDASTEPSDLRQGNSPDERNGDISNPGERKTRPGISKEFTTALGNPIMFMGEIESEGGTLTKLLIEDGDLQTI